MEKNIIDKEKIADAFFDKNINNRERAAFELGIKLGALFHIAIGIPISKNENIIKSIEKGLENAISCQPFVKNVKVKILEENVIGNKSSQYDYSIINPQIFEARVELKYKNISVIGRLKWINELNYPLMYIEKIHE